MTLAINGGKAVRTTPFPAHKTVGREEIDAVVSVMESGVLSKFLGAPHADFYGGPQVRAAEEEWASYFGAKYAISVNSNTSGLICSMGAVGLVPGDEVIVCPNSMSISATAPLFYGATPVFADVEPDTFCISASSLESKITSRTKAIIVVDLFGLPYDVEGINKLAAKHSITVIEDAAQAPGATYNNKFAGTLGDIGVLSLNYHKHIQCGEGGFILTDDAELAERMMLIRNHAESVVGSRDNACFTNMLGFNFRMTEIEASIARCQLKKLNTLIEQRIENVKLIEKGLSEIDALTTPAVRANATHVYYQHALLWKNDIKRNVFIEAVKAELPHYELRESEGVKLGCGYVKPLYNLPIFSAVEYPGYFSAARKDYSDTVCSEAENLFQNTLITHEFMLPSMLKDDIKDVVNAFHKVWELKESI